MTQKTYSQGQPHPRCSQIWLKMRRCKVKVRYQVSCVPATKS